MVEFQTVWGWQPALYLFLGGMGAGALIMSAVLAFVDRNSHRKTIATSLWVSAACMIVGLLLLLAELVHPLRGMLVWQSFVNPTSWMTFGAWGVLLAVIAALIAAALMTPSVARIFGRSADASIDGKGISALLAIGAILGLFVAVYTGILLMAAPGIPLWGTGILPVLFTVSALGTGVALVELISAAIGRRERMTHACRSLLEKATIVLVVVEACVLVAFLLIMASGNGAIEGSSQYAALNASVTAITSGWLSPYFWCLVAGCGLILPAVASILSLRMEGRDVSMIVVSGAVGTLIGGCTLRFIMLYAATHADVVADAVMALIA